VVRSKAQAGGSAASITGLEQFPSVAAALEQSGMLFIKSYGIGSLATPTFRGGAAGQTAIFWNGLPIQSPMLGLTDLSLLPTIGFDNLAAVPGGKSAEAGSGSVSGGIYLSSSAPPAGLRIQGGSTVGSFGYQNQQLAISNGNTKLRVQINGQLLRAENDFPYQIRADLPTKRLAHAQQEQQVLLQTLVWEPNARNKFELHGWQQHTLRNLPPTTTQNRSEATQEDHIYRQQLSWRAQRAKSHWRTNLGFTHEKIHYRDPQILVDAPSAFSSLLAKVVRQQILKPLFYSESGLQFIQSWAIADGYRQAQQQQQLGLYQKLTAELGQWVLAATGRLELVDLSAPLITVFHLQVSHRFKNDWRVELQAGRNFRIPTLNDRYWAQGGNPDLQTEFSWEQEIALAKEIHAIRNSGLVKINIFNRSVANWIQWSQQENAAFWSAGNIAKVWSRGVEPYFIWHYWYGGSQLKVTLRYHFILSTYQTAIQNPAIARGTQLWYTPQHQLTTQVEYRRKKWLVNYTQQYVGATEGINDDLSDYHLAHLTAKWFPQRARWDGQFLLQVNNLYNANYRVIERRPMPGRNLQLGVQVGFSKANKKLPTKKTLP
jgi:vitamin B12 transporter